MLLNIHDLMPNSPLIQAIREKPNREAKIVLHEKISGEKECICGSPMYVVSCGHWLCERQERLKEERSIRIKLDGRKQYIEK